MPLHSDSRKYHLALAPIIESMDFRVLILVGKQRKVLADRVKDLNIESYYFSNAQNLITQLPEFIKANDHVFIKASNGIGLNRLFLS